MFKDDLGGNRNQDLINNIENNQERWKDTAQAAYGIQSDHDMKRNNFVLARKISYDLSSEFRECTPR